MEIRSYTRVLRLLVVCLVLASSAVAPLTPGAAPTANTAAGLLQPRPSTEEALVRWFLDNGGELKVTVGPNAAGVRSLLASTDIKKGDVVASLPPRLAMRLADTNASAAEAATVLLAERHRPASFFRPYLDSLPWPDHPTAVPPLTSELLPPELLPLIQHPGLVRRGGL